MDQVDFIQEILKKIESADPTISKAALLICQDMVDARFLEPLLRKSESSNREVRQLAQDMLKNMVTELEISHEEIKQVQVKVRLETASDNLQNQDPDQRIKAIEYIAQHVEDDEHLEILVHHLEDEKDSGVQIVLIKSLWAFQHPALITVLKGFLASANEDLQIEAAKSLLRQKNGRFLSEIQSFMEGKSQNIQSQIAREICDTPVLLERLAFEFTTVKLIKELFADRVGSRQKALQKLAGVNHPHIRIALLAAVADPDSKVQFAAKKLLSRPSGPSGPFPAAKPQRRKVPRKKAPVKPPRPSAAYQPYLTLIVLAVASSVLVWFMVREGSVMLVESGSGTAFYQDTDSEMELMLKTGKVPAEVVEFRGSVCEVDENNTAMVVEVDSCYVSFPLPVSFTKTCRAGDTVSVQGTVVGLTEFGTIIVEPDSVEP